MYELKKIGKVFTSKSVGTGLSSCEKRIYQAAVSQRLRNTALDLEAGIRPNFPVPVFKISEHPMTYTKLFTYKTNTVKNGFNLSSEYQGISSPPGQSVRGAKLLLAHRLRTRGVIPPYSHVHLSVIQLRNIGAQPGFRYQGGLTLSLSHSKAQMGPVTQTLFLHLMSASDFLRPVEVLFTMTLFDQPSRFFLGHTPPSTPPILVAKWHSAPSDPPRPIQTPITATFAWTDLSHLTL